MMPMYILKLTALVLLRIYSCHYSLKLSNGEQLTTEARVLLVLNGIGEPHIKASLSAP